MSTHFSIFRRRAVVEVAPECVKLLVADVCGDRINPIRVVSEITLRENSHGGRRQLLAEVTSNARSAVIEFVSEAENLGAEFIRIVAATPAHTGRESVEFADAVVEASGLAVECLTSQQQAGCLFRTISCALNFPKTPLVVVHTEGDNVEVLFRDAAAVHSQNNFSIDLKPLWDQIVQTDLPSAADFAQCRAVVADVLHWELAPSLTRALDLFRPIQVRLVGTGGGSAAIARIVSGKLTDANDCESFTVADRNQVNDAVRLLWRLPREQRRRLDGLPAKRADEILLVAMIFEQMMARFDFQHLTIGRWDWRHGLLLKSDSHSLLDTDQRTGGSRFSSPTAREPRFAETDATRPGSPSKSGILLNQDQLSG